MLRVLSVLGEKIIFCSMVRVMLLFRFGAGGLGWQLRISSTEWLDQSLIGLVEMGENGGC